MNGSMLDPDVIILVLMMSAAYAICFVRPVNQRRLSRVQAAVWIKADMPLPFTTATVVL